MKEEVIIGRPATLQICKRCKSEATLTRTKVKISSRPGHYADLCDCCIEAIEQVVVDFLGEARVRI